MKCTYSCNTEAHRLARRRFLGGLAAGLGASFGLGAFARPAAARRLESTGRRVLVIFLHGGASQLETWDPKPGTDTGGPFLSIPTTVPGLHISELLPRTAKEMHRLAVVRSLDTAEDDHGKGQYLMTRGRRQEPASDYPHLGAVCAKALAPPRSPLPGYIRITPGGGGGSTRDSAYLGPRHDGIVLGSGGPPQNIARPESLTPEEDMRRRVLRARFDERFLLERRTAQTEAYTYSYEQAARLMERRDVFDATKEPPRVVERYGTHDFGRHCLLARRLLEQGVTFVEVNHSNYDTHNENFDFHIEQMKEFDATFATLIEDLAQRGMLETTLVVVMSEFGRTPQINSNLGRDHWSKAWSVVLGGCGIQTEGVIGKTSANGTEVVERPLHHGHLFHTYLKAVGLDPNDEFDVGGRSVPMANPADDVIKELLA
jgi:hypothetical protein